MNNRSFTTWLPWLLAAVVVLVVPGCRTPSAASGAVDRAVQAAVHDSGDASSESGSATHVLRIGGALLTLAGLAIVAARFLGMLTAPLIGGILTVGAGIAALSLADLMSRFWWIGPVMLLGLVVLAVIEHLNDRNLLWRSPPEVFPPPEAPPPEAEAIP